ncbi:hypothetical protein RDI58_010891 [Solanum bulbocastanum]|uniref:DUF7903 domain-containing protein n=1 Tax=Solanum bulbocastanum TaxID=147425 RepID=A0AAN8TQ47_SOLBU
MSYIPPHKRQIKGSPSLEPTPAPESLIRSAFNKKKDNKFRPRNLGYTDHTILKWFFVGFADELRFSSLVSFQPLSPESFETKSGLQPLSLVSTYQETPWLLITANVKKDLLLSFQHMKREMEEADMAQVKPSVVARFGKVLFYGTSSIGKDSLKLNSLTETTLRKMKGSFHTDVPPPYMDYVENRVVENLGQEYVQGKELYYVKLSDKLRTESIVSCKCTVAKDHNKIQLYKIELNRVRHMVADMSILGKSSDLRLFVYTKKIKMALSDEEINEIKDLIGSAILDSEVPGGIRWPLDKRPSSGGRYVVNAIGHTTAKSYMNSSIRFKFRHANRSKFKSSTGEVTREIFLKMPGIVSELRVVRKWFPVGLTDDSHLSSLVKLQPLSIDRKSDENPLRLVLIGGTNELMDEPWRLVANSVMEDLLLSFQRVNCEMEESNMEELKLNLVARFGRILFHGISAKSQESLKSNLLSETTLRQMKKTFYSNVLLSYMEYIRNLAVEKLDLECVEEKELYYGKDDEINEIKNLIGSAVLDSEVKGGLRWPFGEDSSGSQYAVTGICHTTVKSYGNSSIKFKLRHAD